MLEYGEILRYLAKNPPQIDAERQLHASLLELLAKCLRTNERVIEIGQRQPQERRLAHYPHPQDRRPAQEHRLPQYPQQRRLPMS
jgi:hypothetical protein